MKFTAIAIALFAAAGLAAPNPEAEAEATFLDNIFKKVSPIFGIDASCPSCNVCEPCGSSSPVGVNGNIFLTPSGALTYGNTVSGSVACKGTVINGHLYVNSPFIGNGLGRVGSDNSGKLFVDTKAGGSSAWSVQNQQIFSSGNPLFACPDSNGNHYLYNGGNQKYKKPINLSCN